MQQISSTARSSIRAVAGSLAAALILVGLAVTLSPTFADETQLDPDEATQPVDAPPEPRVIQRADAVADDELIGDAVSTQQEHFFEQRIRPVLAASCYECHATDADQIRGGLVLDTSAGIRIGGDTGPAVVPGDPDSSALIQAVRYHDQDLAMPPDGRLDDQAIADLEQWVEMGAADPRPFDPADVPHYEGIDWDAARAHWAFQPMDAPTPPAVENDAWVRSDIDRFVLAKLEANDLEPAPETDRHTWLRRVTYTLTGLPPTPQEIEAFIDDDAPDAHARVVDRLLASPHYGERWGRHWLDLARYADSNGADENLAYGQAWRYRDYVIDSFNADKPYDQFITEQLAGDLMGEAETDAERFERWTALGFLAIGPKILAEQDKEKMLLDIADEQIDVMSQSLMAITVSCARCHDHKFDPITEDDYYALAGIFRSTEMMRDLDIILSRWRERPLETEQMAADRASHAQRLDATREQLAGAEAEAQAMVQARWRGQADAYLVAATEVVNGTPLDQAAAGGAEAGAAGEAAGGREGGLDPIILQRWVDVLEQAADDSASPLSLWLAVHGEDGHDRDAFREAVAPLAAEHLADVPADAADQALDAYRRYFAALADVAPQPGFDESLELRDGRVGSALYTDGHTFKLVPHAAELEPAELTLEAWVYVEPQNTEGDARRWVVAKNANEWVDGHYALVVENNRARAYLNIGGGQENAHTVASTTGSIGRQQWHHLAMTYDGQILRLYLDGERAGETRIDTPRTAGDGPLNFGRRPDGHVGFTGRIDETHLYGRPLGADEIAARYNSPEQPIDAGLVRAWPFDVFKGERRAAIAQERLRAHLHEADGLFAIPDPADAYYGSEQREQIAALRDEVAELEQTLPPEPPQIMTVFEADEPVDLPVHIRGSHLTLADEPTPRRTPEIFDELLDPPQMPGDASGRLELARWLTDPEHPLTARVMVNRIWQHHFGEGLVRTPSNFGLRGVEPTHPQLLDYLARRFIDNGWSIKQLHREILLSSTYRMSTAHDSVAAAADPENELLWRMNRQRLEAEPIRDALLAVAGTLDAQMGGSLLVTESGEYVRGERQHDFEAYAGSRRSIYLPIIRNAVHPMFAIFDYADAGVTTAQRPSTTVSHQALFMMNAPVVHEQAAAFAERVLGEPDRTAEQRVDKAYLLALGRPARAHEVDDALEFITHARQMAEAEGRDADAARAEAWRSFCQLLYASSEFIFID